MQPIVGIRRLLQTGNGYYLVASDGGVFAFGTGAADSKVRRVQLHLVKPVVGMALG